jgi:hypothetical protein
MELSALKAAAATPGAISICELVAIHQITKEFLCSLEGMAADLGSHAGKSSIAGAAGCYDAGMRGAFYMVDPVYDLGNVEAWKQTVQGEAWRAPWNHIRAKDFDEKTETVVRVNSGMIPVLCGQVSLPWLKTITGKFSYVFIDSDDHQPELVMAEVRELEDRMFPGGLILFHDFGNQYHGPKEAWNYLQRTGKFEAIEPNWDAAREVSRTTGLEATNDSWHARDNPFPCFVGAVRKL